MHIFVKSDKIFGKCDSCPFTGEIDNKHRLDAFIMKKPPVYIPQAPKNVQKIEKVKDPK